MKFIQNVLRFLLGHRYSPYYTGVKEDGRSHDEKQKDYAHEERAATPVVSVWFNKILESQYPYENQLSTSSCVPHGVLLPYAILLEKVRGYYIRLSQMFIYRMRSNFPGQGMSPWECFELVRKMGSCLFETLPTPQNESEANKIVINDPMRTEAMIFSGAEYFTLTTTKNSIDEIAKVAAQGLAVSLTIFASYREWAQRYVGTYDKPDFAGAEIRHEITVLPYGGFIEQGTKYVAIQDSAWFAGLKIRYVSEDFIQARVYDARYWITVKLTPGVGEKPKHVFSQPLSLGSKGSEVMALQRCLVYEGLLPNDCVTGNFLGRTLAAVRVFQEKYENDILKPLDLSAPTGMVGPATMKKLNALYGA